MKKRAQRVEVELIQPHRHGRMDLARGDRIRVSPPVRDFLTARGIARELGAAPRDDEAEAGAEAPGIGPDEPSNLEE